MLKLSVSLILVPDGSAAAGKAAPGFFDAGLLIRESKINFLGPFALFDGCSRCLVAVLFRLFSHVEGENGLFDISYIGLRRCGRQFDALQVAINSYSGFSAVCHGFNHETGAQDITAGEDTGNVGGETSGIYFEGSSLGGLDLAAARQEIEVGSLADSGDDHVGFNFLGFALIVFRGEFAALVVAGGAALQLHTGDLAAFGEDLLWGPSSYRS